MDLKTAIGDNDRLLRDVERRLKLLAERRKQVAERVDRVEHRGVLARDRLRRDHEARLEALRKQLKRELEEFDVEVDTEKALLEKERSNLSVLQGQLEEERTELLQERDSLFRVVRRFVGRMGAGDQRDKTATPSTEAEETLPAEVEAVIALLRDSKVPLHESEIAASVYPEVLDLLKRGSGLRSTLRELQHQGLLERRSNGLWASAPDG